MSPAVDGSGFEVDEHPFRDADEPDAYGLHEYYYSGTNFEFRFDGGVEMKARVYDDTPHQASFVQPTLTQVEAQRAQFHVAVEYLRTRKNVEEVLVLGGPSGGYERVDVPHSVPAEATEIAGVGRALAEADEPDWPVHGLQVGHSSGTLCRCP